MKLVDVNVLVYALDEDAHHHRRSRAWLEAALGGREAIGFAWVVVLAFLRLTASAALAARPLARGVGPGSDPASRRSFR